MSRSRDRFDEIRGKFAPNANFHGRRVFLVDDVMTTGATASECADMCLGAGAMEVHALIAARNFQFLEGRQYG